MKKKYTPSLHRSIPEKKQTGGGSGYGISQRYVEFPGETKKKLCGISRGLGFWFWNFQGM